MPSTAQLSGLEALLFPRQTETSEGEAGACECGEGFKHPSAGAHHEDKVTDRTTQYPCTWKLVTTPLAGPITHPLPWRPFQHPPCSSPIGLQGKELLLPLSSPPYGIIHDSHYSQFQHHHPNIWMGQRSSPQPSAHTEDVKAGRLQGSKPQG